MVHVKGSNVGRPGRGPLLAWEKISTALYVHEWARQVKGCNLIFCMLASECCIGRLCQEAGLQASQRGILDVPC